jgi:hypothetical protein
MSRKGLCAGLNAAQAVIGSIPVSFSGKAFKLAEFPAGI